MARVDRPAGFRGGGDQGQGGHRRPYLGAACLPGRRVCGARRAHGAFRGPSLSAPQRCRARMPGGGRRRALGERLRRSSRTAPGDRDHGAGGRGAPGHRSHARQSRQQGLSHVAGAQRAAGALSGRRGRFLYESPATAGAAPAACASCGSAAVKIAILSRKSDLYSTRRLVEAGSRRGHDMRVIDPLRCYMNIATDRPMIHYHGEALTGFDAVIPRIGASVTFYGTAVLRQFEMMGGFPLNESVAITRARDKLRSLQLLSRRGSGLPMTAVAHAPDDTGEVLDMVGGAPVVIKLVEGTQGIGVVLAETTQAAEGLIETFWNFRANILVQEFVKEAGGADLRCFVIGKKVVAAMKRQAKHGDFRSNLHRGGTARLVKLTPEDRATAVRAAKVIGLNVAGVDILRSKRGPLVLEVNSSPGLEGIEAASGKDVAGMIITFIEDNAKPNKTRTRGKG